MSARPASLRRPQRLDHSVAAQYPMPRAKSMRPPRLQLDPRRGAARPECPPAWPRSVPGAAHAQMPAMRPRTPATHAAPPASTREPSTVRGGGLDGWAGAPITRGRVEAPRAPSIACAAIQLLHSGDGRRQSRPPARLGLQCLPVPRLTAGLAGRGEYKRRPKSAQWKRWLDGRAESGAGRVAMGVVDESRRVPSRSSACIGPSPVAFPHRRCD